VCWRYVAVCCSVLHCTAAAYCNGLPCEAAVRCHSVLQCVAVCCCSVLQCAAVCCSVLQCVAVCCSVLQCVAVCCTVLRQPYLHDVAARMLLHPLLHAYIHTHPFTCMHICTRPYVYFNIHHSQYGVATISRLLKIVGLFCRISSLLQGSFAKETYNFKEPTNRSHPIRDIYSYIHSSHTYNVYLYICLLIYDVHFHIHHSYT